MDVAGDGALIVGDLRVRRIVDLDPFALPMSLIFPDRSLADLDAGREVLAGTHIDFEQGLVLLAVQSHLVRIGGKTILVDTCVGEHKRRPRRAEWDQRKATGYIAALAQAGFAPEDIDIVMCTHLHVDHVGWNTMLRDGRWVPTFPNARYAMGGAELAFWRETVRQTPEVNHGSFADSVMPVIESGQSWPVATGEMLAEGAAIIPLPGHTPGQIGLSLTAAGGERALICGDALHSPAQVFRPDWSSGFCADPAQSTATRRSLFATAADEDVVVVPGHLRVPGMRIRRERAGFRPVFCGCGVRPPPPRRAATGSSRFA